MMTKGTTGEMRVFIFLVITMFVYVSAGDFCIAEVQENDRSRKVVFSIDFRDYQEGSIESWLNTKGFQFKLGANNRRARGFDIDEKGLIVEIKKPIIGYLLNESVSDDRVRFVVFGRCTPQ